MTRVRDLGVTIGTGTPGPRNAITDVEGIRVGATTLVEGDAVRTGVTVIVPPDEPLFAGTHRLNGNGELTGLEWVRESGMLTTPLAITNTHSVGVVHDALIESAIRRGMLDDAWSLPVVGETWDGVLNDINGLHVRREHVFAALESATEDVPEGNAGGGTGMICHGFKGGTGTASRLAEAGWTVGVLVQANHGRRERLLVDGVHVGRAIGPDRVPLPERPGAGAGSIIVVVATDAPLLPTQCDRLAHRAALGIGRTGGAGENSSGDLLLAFSTGNRGLADGERTARVEMVRNEGMDGLFDAAIEATEEAIVNALVAAETLTGKDGHTAHALPHDELVAAMAAKPS
jgi:D-aminopeptidase